MPDEIHHIEVFYIAGNTGWVITANDAEGNQIGDAAYEWRKAQAITTARIMAAGKPIKVFGRDGQLQNELQP